MIIPIIGTMLLIALILFTNKIYNRIEKHNFENACGIINGELYEIKTSKYICSVNNTYTNTDGDTDYYTSRIYKTNSGKYFEAYAEELDVKLRGLSEECVKTKIANENLIGIYKNEFGLNNA